MTAMWLDHECIETRENRGLFTRLVCWCIGHRWERIFHRPNDTSCPRTGWRCPRCDSIVVWWYNPQAAKD